MDLIIVSGMSGAGKTKAINTLEDLGFYCVDNLPPKLLPLLNAARTDANDHTAVVIDARCKEGFCDFEDALETLDRQRMAYKLVFLDADTPVLLQRYKETRRKHPVMEADNMSLEEAIERERALLQPLRNRADYLINTSLILPAQLKEQIVALVTGTDGRQQLWIHCLSFGFKRGLPADADLVFDVRCLPNPFYDPKLKPMSGLDEPVASYVLGFEQARALLSKLQDLLRFSVPLYVSEGKSQLVVAVGCTGGQHRSVTFAQAIGDDLKAQGYTVTVTHRDMARNPAVHG
ncbi:MAG TPA: RNase adapter RapZ [Clostridia bacterium]|nr:RNase adapter RapZ [Clostridia bacterium]